MSAFRRPLASTFDQRFGRRSAISERFGSCQWLGAREAMSPQMLLHQSTGGQTAIVRTNLDDLRLPLREPETPHLGQMT
jgi:hypothetical protein